MSAIKELLRSVFADLLAGAIVASVSLLLLIIGLGKIESGYIVIVLVAATVSGIAIYRLARRPFRFLKASKSGIGPSYLFTNQLECKDEIKENFRTAKRTKILTARGGRYFRPDGWFYDPLVEEKGRNDQIQVLVCSSESPHIDEELAQRLRSCDSAEEVRGMMHANLIYLGSLSRRFSNILIIRVYAEKPIWNILIFDDVMYVAPYVEHKSHEKAAVFKFQRHDRSHFVGFESHFDRLWFRSRPLEEFLADLDSHV
jgi:hypothetical protein